MVVKTQIPLKQAVVRAYVDGCKKFKKAKGWPNIHDIMEMVEPFISNDQWHIIDKPARQEYVRKALASVKNDLGARGIEVINVVLPDGSKDPRWKQVSLFDAADYAVCSEDKFSMARKIYKRGIHLVEECYSRFKKRLPIPILRPDDED